MSGELHIRNVRPDDLEQVWRVHVAASNDGLVRSRRRRSSGTPGPSMAYRGRHDLRQPR